MLLLMFCLLDIWVAIVKVWLLDNPIWKCGTTKSQKFHNYHPIVIGLSVLWNIPFKTTQWILFMHIYEDKFGFAFQNLYVNDFNWRGTCSSPVHDLIILQNLLKVLAYIKFWNLTWKSSTENFNLHSHYKNLNFESTLSPFNLRNWYENA